MCRCLLGEHESGRLQTAQWISLTLAHIRGSGQEKSPVLPRGLSWLQPHLPLSLPCPVKAPSEASVTRGITWGTMYALPLEVKSPRARFHHCLFLLPHPFLISWAQASSAEERALF